MSDAAANERPCGAAPLTTAEHSRSCCPSTAPLQANTAHPVAVRKNNKNPSQKERARQELAPAIRAPATHTSPIFPASQSHRGA